MGECVGGWVVEAGYNGGDSRNASRTGREDSLVRILAGGFGGGDTIV